MSYKAPRTEAKNSLDLDINLQSGDTQNFLGKFIRFFVTLRCFYGVAIHGKLVHYDLYSSQHHPLILSASKSTLRLNNLKILRPKVTKNLTN